MKIRSLASAILAAAIRHAPSEIREWGNAMQREMDFVASDWAALFWAIGSATALLKHLEVPVGDPSDIRRKAQGLEKRIARRTLMGPIVCSFLVAYFGWFACISPTLTQRIGACLTGASLLYGMYQVYRWRGGKLPPLDISASALTSFYRTELERQRDFHRGICFWSRLVSMIPGYVLFCMGMAIAHPKTKGVIAVILTCFFALAVLAVPNNLMRARRYQRQIDELDALPKEP